MVNEDCIFYKDNFCSATKSNITKNYCPGCPKNCLKFIAKKSKVCYDCNVRKATEVIWSNLANEYIFLCKKCSKNKEK